jgi:hypothetical protein
MAKYFIGTLEECQSEQILNDACMNLSQFRDKVALTWNEPEMIDNIYNIYHGKYFIEICPMREQQVTPLFDYNNNWRSQE